MIGQHSCGSTNLRINGGAERESMDIRNYGSKDLRINGGHKVRSCGFTDIGNYGTKSPRNYGCSLISKDIWILTK